MGADGKAAQDIRNALTDPVALCEQLGLRAGAKKQARGLIVLCPVHGEHRPSCSVSVGPDGTVRVKCFSCGYGGDALSLIAAVHNLDLRGSRFKEVLIIGAELAGLHDLLDSLRRDTDYQPRERPPPPRVEPDDAVDYPNAAEVAALWAACVPVTDDLSVAELLRERALSAEAVALLDLARALPASARLPRWASYQGKSWLRTGHRLILPVYDHDGARRSVRAWRVVPDDTPKRLPPGGHKAAQLVLANTEALLWLQHSEALPYIAPPMKLIVAEGEPDFLSRATTNRYDAVLGLMSGSWHKGFADKIPTGSEVCVVTHRDDAGDRYAAEVMGSIKNPGVSVYRIEREKP